MTTDVWAISRYAKSYIVLAIAQLPIHSSSDHKSENADQF